MMNLVDSMSLIRSCPIGIAGCGGIGSNVARFLVEAGFKRLRLVDFDEVEESNLNRQFFSRGQLGEKKATALGVNLRGIYTDLVLEIENCRLTEDNIVSIFEGCDIVVEGLDQKGIKSLLLEKIPTSCSIVGASGIAGGECDSIRRVDLNSRITIIGDFVSDIEAYPLFGYKVSAVASRMTEVVIEKLLNLKGKTSGGGEDE